MLETPGLTLELVDAWKKMGLDPIKELQRYEEVGKWSTDNLIYGVTPSYLYYHAWSGATPWGAFPTRNCLLRWMVLTSTATEVSYMGEETNQYNYSDPSTVPDIVSSNAWLDFNSVLNAQWEIAVDADGREAVVGNFKFLFLPGIGTSSEIRSLTLWQHSSYSYQYRQRIGRVRVKDSNGVPVTLNKTAVRSLLVQYLVTLPTI